MNRRGVALVAVLWTVTLLAGIVALGLRAVHTGQSAARNRVTLTRSRWAAEACWAIAQARRANGSLADTGTVDLGRGTRCRWRVDDPTARVNVNAADEGLLAALFQQAGLHPDSARLLTAALVEYRARQPFTAVEQLKELPGYDSLRELCTSRAEGPSRHCSALERAVRRPDSALTCPPGPSAADSCLRSLVSVDGPGFVNASSAAPAVLAALPGLTQSAVALLLRRREWGRPIAGLDELVAALDPASREAMRANYAYLAPVLRFAPSQLLFTLTGWVESVGPDPHATIEFLVTPLPERLAVLRRRTS